MSFESYNGSIKLAAGLTPAGSGYPLMQSCDIQVDKNGNRLDTMLKQIITRLNSSIPIEVSSEEAMTALLTNATAASVGAIYKYTGSTTSTYTRGELYIIQEE